MISSGINLVMTVIGFAVSTMFIVFVCTRLVCARVQLNASRRSFPTATRSDLSILERGLHGLEPMVVATFPTREFGDEFLSSGADTQCTVCLAEYQEKDTLRTLPSCGHAFHACCIDIWLRQHSTCPVCRISLRFTLEKRRILPPMFSSVVRSHRGSPDTCDNSYMYSSNEFHSRTDDNQRLESIEEDDFQIDNVRARETMPPGEMGGDHTLGKHVESPSNP